MLRSTVALLVVVLLPGASAASILTAGDVDDHLNWAHYLRYAGRMGGGQNGSGLPVLGLDDRVTLHIENEDGRSLPMTAVTLRPHGAASPQARLQAGTDGVLHFFPRHDGFASVRDFDLVLESGGKNATARLDLDALPADRSLTFEIPGAVPQLPTSIDLMFVIDTTGSMGDELHYITAELESIVAEIAASNPDMDIRLGLTLYRDEGDDYVVRKLGFTSSVATMKSWLAQQQAAGGGDTPEAMDEGLAQAVAEQWRTGRVARMLVLVADAAPHPQGYAPFLEAASQAREQGVHIYPLAASGVESAAEYLMRAAAVLTQGRYMFLTDDSGVGNSHAEPTIPCYLVTKLDDLLVRVVDSELQGRRIEPDPQDVLRRSGTYERGVCLAASQEEQPGSQSSASSEGAGGAVTDMGGGGSGVPALGISGADSRATGTMTHADTDAVAEAPVPEPPARKTPGAGLALSVVALLVGLVAAGMRRRWT